MSEEQQDLAPEKRDKFEVKCSYVEIYKDKLYDLLDPSMPELNKAETVELTGAKEESLSSEHLDELIRRSTSLSRH